MITSNSKSEAYNDADSFSVSITAIRAFGTKPEANRNALYVLPDPLGPVMASFICVPLRVAFLNIFKINLGDYLMRKCVPLGSTFANRIASPSPFTMASLKLL